MNVKRKLAVTLCLTGLAGAGCGLFSKMQNTETPLTKTDAGTPTGPAISKTIGPGGGTVSTPDGKITLTVPANALAGNVDLSIQPITNKVPGGLGDGFRLEPEGQNFASPIKVAFKYDDAAFNDLGADSIAVAYQNKAGDWRSIDSVEGDPASRTLTVSTTHFSDWSLWTFKLKPEKATLRVNETLELELSSCLELRSTTYRIYKFFYKAKCPFVTTQEPTWTASSGTITRTGGNAVVYQAPAKKPSPNVVKVRFVFHLPGESPNQSEARESEITIIDQAYKVSGGKGGTNFSGTICDVENPFVLHTNNPFLGDFDFTPSSPTGGKWLFATKHGVSGGGGGDYTIEGPEGARSAITLTGGSTGCILGHCASGTGGAQLTLTPIGPESCGN